VGEKSPRVRRCRLDVPSLCPSAVRAKDSDAHGVLVALGATLANSGGLIGERLGGLDRVGGQDRRSPDACRSPCRAADGPVDRPRGPISREAEARDAEQQHGQGGGLRSRLRMPTDVTRVVDLELHACIVMSMVLRRLEGPRTFRPKTIQPLRDHGSGAVGHERLAVIRRSGLRSIEHLSKLGRWKNDRAENSHQPIRRGGTLRTAKR
jgi:hypothetical protein